MSATVPNPTTVSQINQQVAPTDAQPKPIVSAFDAQAQQQIQQLAGLQQQIQAASGQPTGILDMASVLSKIQALEQEKRDMLLQMQSKDAKLEKLTESKRAEMQQLLEGTISKFLQDLQTKDEKTKTDLKAGLERLAQRGDESGVWEVMACASAAHVQRVNELESLRTEVNAFREREKMLQGGMFATEESRISSSEVGMKRKSDDISDSTGVPNIFDEFTRTFMERGGIDARFTE
jgi:DNA repair exonuclease SbcCD ATPase subunit